MKKIHLGKIRRVLWVGAFLPAVLSFAGAVPVVICAAETENPEEEMAENTEENNKTEQWTPPAVKIKKIELLSKKSIGIKWKKVSKADGYYVCRITDSGKVKTLKKIKTTAVTEYTDTGLKYGKTYKYAVRAYKEHGGKTYKSTYDEEGGVKKLKVKSKYQKGYKYFYDMDGRRINDATSFVGKKKSYLIKVNLQKNVVTIYAKGGKKGYTIPVRAWLCSGKKESRLGTFSLGVKYRYRSLYFQSYSQWSVRIYDSILFHTVPYTRGYNANSLDVKQYNLLGTSASHGCIRLQCEAVKWIYDNCRSGTKVVFYRSGKAGALGKPALEKLPKWHTWDPTDPTMKKKCKEKKCHQV